MIPGLRITAHVACGQTSVSEWGLDENADGNLAFTPEAAVTWTISPFAGCLSDRNLYGERIVSVLLLTQRKMWICYFYVII